MTCQLYFEHYYEWWYLFHFSISISHGNYFQCVSSHNGPLRLHWRLLFRREDADNFPLVSISFGMCPRGTKLEGIHSHPCIRSAPATWPSILRKRAIFTDPAFKPRHNKLDLSANRGARFKMKIYIPPTYLRRVAGIISHVRNPSRRE